MTPFDPYRASAVEMARRYSPAPGMKMRHTFYCVRCNEDRPQAGGRMRGGMFLCSAHFKAKEQVQ